MSIEKISGIGHGHIKNIKGNQALKKDEGVKPVADTTKESGKLNVVDKVEISDEVQGLQKTLSDLKAELKKVPDVRHEKVNEAKIRVESGFYDKRETIEKVASEIKKTII